MDCFYKGQSCDLSDRIKRHNLKHEKATAKGAPWVLLWSTSKPSRSDAVMLERKLKNLSKMRVIEFISKYKEGIAGPDEFLLLEKLSGC